MSMSFSNRVEIALRRILLEIGVPYVWGGQTPRQGWDCSGLVVEYLATMGQIPPDADATAQMLHNMAHVDSGMCPKRGDIVFIGGSPNRVTHCGVYMGHGLYLNAEKPCVRIRKVRRMPYVVYADPMSVDFRS